MKTSYTNAEIDSMVNDVTSQLDALLKSEGASLLKKFDDSGTGESMEMAQKAAPDASASPEATSPSPEASASAGDQSLPDDAAPTAPAPEGSAPSPEAAPTMDELVQAYSSLPPADLQLHAQALAQVMQSQSAGAAPAPGGAPAPAPDASAAPAPAAPLAGEDSQQVGPEAQAAMKSEVATLKAQLAELKKSNDALASIVTNVVKPKTIVVTAPKAITGDTALVKSEIPSAPLTKSEVTKVLNEHARNPNLAKSDRDLIRRYYTGQASLKSLDHLFKK